MQLQGMVRQKPDHYVYCVSCNTGSERRVAERLKQAIDKEVIFPVRVMKKRKGGEWLEEEIPLTPGYVFIYSDSEVNLEGVRKLGINRVLSYGEDFRELHGGDYEFAMWVHKYKGRVHLSRVLVEGSTVRIIDGPLSDSIVRIKKLDKHKQKAMVTFSFASILQEVWLSFDYLGDPVETKRTN